MIDFIPAEYIPAVVSGAAFVALLLLATGIYQLYRYAVRKQQILDKISPETAAGGGGAGSLPEPAGGKLFGSLGRIGERLSPERSVDYQPTRIRFLRAGLRGPRIPAVFWGVKFTLAFTLMIGFLLLRLSVISVLNPQMSVLLALIFAVAGYYLPDLWLKLKIAARKQKIMEGLPDALDLLVVCVEAGMGLDAAIQRVAEEMKLSNKPLSDELSLINLELRAGKSREDALKNLTLRTDIEDLNNLVVLMIQTDKFGTSMAQTLRVYSETFRTRRYQRAEEVATKLPVKLTLPLILFIFPALFVTIMGPAMIRVYEMFLK